MVLVKKKYRGYGISKVLMNSVLDELNEVKSIKLDATDAGRNVYRKFGFIDEYKISRWINTSFNSELILANNYIEAVGISDLRKIVEFDKEVFGAERHEIISAWINKFPDKCWLARDKNKITGFALGRVGNRFHQIGPVSAKNTHYAIKLISKQLKQLKGKPVVLDVMDDKSGLTVWLKDIGFERKRGFTRMFLKKNPFPGEPDKQYLICGPEFG
jgi:hypothetical protein